MPKGNNADAVNAVIESEEAIFKQAKEQGKAIDPFGATTEDANYEEMDTNQETLKIEAPEKPEMVVDKKQEEPPVEKKHEEPPSTVTPSLKSAAKKKDGPDADKLFN